MTDELRALHAGLPADLLLVLMDCRRLWHQTNSGEEIDGGHETVELSSPLPTWWWADEHLAAAVHHPLAPQFDEVFVAAMRRVL